MNVLHNSAKYLVYYFYQVANKHLPPAFIENYIFYVLSTGARLGHMKNALVGVVYIVIIKHPRMHSSY